MDLGCRLGDGLALAFGCGRFRLWRARSALLLGGGLELHIRNRASAMRDPRGHDCKAQRSR